MFSLVYFDRITSHGFFYSRGVFRMFIVIILLLFFQPGYTFSQGHNENHLNYKDELFKFSIVTSNFARFKLDTTLQMLKRLGIPYICIKDVHLPLNSSPEQISALTAKVEAEGIKVYSVGLIYMRTQADVDKAFEYAKTVGVKLIVGTPTHELLPYIAQKVKQFDIKIAIHIHGGDIELYPMPKM